jgi:hypothetical protein
MFPSHSPAIYEFLKEQRLLPLAQLEELNEEHKATGKPLADVVIDLGMVEKDDFLRRIAAHLGYDYVAELPVQFPGEAIAALTGKLARDYGVMPLQADAQNIDLLVADPFNTSAVDDLTFALDRKVRLYFADFLAAIFGQGERSTVTPPSVNFAIPILLVLTAHSAVNSIPLPSSQRRLLRFGLLAKKINMLC